MKYPIFRFRYVNVDSKDHYKITLFVDPKIKEIITNKLARLRMTLRDFGRMV